MFGLKLNPQVPHRAPHVLDLLGHVSFRDGPQLGGADEDVQVGDEAADGHGRDEDVEVELVLELVPGPAARPHRHRGRVTEEGTGAETSGLNGRRVGVCFPF